MKNVESFAEDTASLEGNQLYLSSVGVCFYGMSPFIALIFLFCLILFILTVLALSCFNFIFTFSPLSLPLFLSVCQNRLPSDLKLRKNA